MQVAILDLIAVHVDLPLQLPAEGTQGIAHPCPDAITKDGARAIRAARFPATAWQSPEAQKHALVFKPVVAIAYSYQFFAVAVDKCIMFIGVGRHSFVGLALDKGHI